MATVRVIGCFPCGRTELSPSGSVSGMAVDRCAWGGGFISESLFFV